MMQENQRLYGKFEGMVKAAEAIGRLVRRGDCRGGFVSDGRAASFFPRIS